MASNWYIPPIHWQNVLFTKNIFRESGIRSPCFPGPHNSKTKCVLVTTPRGTSMCGCGWQRPQTQLRGIPRFLMRLKLLAYQREDLTQTKFWPISIFILHSLYTFKSQYPPRQKAIKNLAWTASKKCCLFMTGLRIWMKIWNESRRVSFVLLIPLTENTVN